MRGDADYESKALVPRSLADSLYDETKATGGSGGGLPFPGYGGYGAVPVYSSWDSWDAAMDLRFSGAGGRQKLEFANRIGDLSANSLLCAAIRWLGNTIQEAPLTVREKNLDEAGRGKSNAVADHPLANLWETPNEHYSGATLRKAIAFSWILNSNSYLIVNYNDFDEPTELWWEPHWTIRPVWPIDGSEFVSYYEVNRNGTWMKVPVENVIHLRDGLSPYNQRVGFSGIPSILPELYGDGEAAAYYATLMGGSAIPPFMVAIDKDLRMGQPEIDAFTRDLINKTTGRKRGQPIVAKGAKAYKLGWSPKDLDFRESRYMAEDRFCAVMGIPAVVLELGTGMAHSIYNNVKQAEARAWDSYVTPMLSQIAKELTTQLLIAWEEKGNGRYCEHDLSKVQALQEDEKEKAERWEGLYTAGIAMRSEARSAMNLGPSDEANPEADKVFAVMSAPEKQAADEVAAERKQKELEARTGNAFGPRQLGAGAQPAQNTPKGRAAIAIVKAVMATTDDTEVSWVDFPESWNGKGIDRSSMPQVKSEHRGAMIRFLKGRGIAYSREEIYPTELRPSQAQYSPEKVERARNYTGRQRPLLVSRDSFVADGHHQWVAALDNPEEKITIIRLDADILELLLEIARFPSSGVAAMKSILDEDEEDSDESFFKNCGTGGGGFKPGNTCGGRSASGGGGGGGGGAAGAATEEQAGGVVEQIPLNDKVAKARASYSPAEKGAQDFAENNEVKLAQALGGKALPDNEPIDVQVKTDTGLHGLEVKTMVTTRNDKITMNAPAIQRKKEWEKKNSGIVHTVIIDDRHVYNGGKNKDLHSGNRLYYKRGVGSYRLGSMHAVKDHKELKTLIDTPTAKLPAKAKG